LSTRLVLVFARLPEEESRTKPLVASCRSRRHVESLYERLFSRTLAIAGSTGTRTRLVTHGELPPRFWRDGLEVRQQAGDTFASRLEHAVREAFADGYREVVLVGGDTPALATRHLDDAFARLEGRAERAAVVGPAHDGGYYLLALNAHEPALFTDVPLGTSRVRDATEAILAREGYAVSHLQALHDLDDERDVRRVALEPGVLRALAARVLEAAPAFDLPDVLVARRFAAAIQARGPPSAP